MAWLIFGRVNPAKRLARERRELKVRFLQLVGKRFYRAGLSKGRLRRLLRKSGEGEVLKEFERRSRRKRG